MSALFDLLKRTIERVNNTPLLDKQGKVSETVIPDSIARVNNLPIAEQVIPDWEQNDSTKPDYVKNRTHFKYEGADTSICLLKVEATTLTLIDSGDELAWSDEKYVVTTDRPEGISESLRESWLDGRGPRYMWDPFSKDYVPCTYTSITHNTGDGNSYEYVFECDSFMLTSPYSYNDNGNYARQPNWYVIPKTVLDKSQWGEKTTEVTFSTRLYRATWRYHTLSSDYISTSKWIGGGEDNTSIPTVGAVVHALKNQVDFNNLQNRPFYFIPEHYKDCYGSGYIVGKSPIELGAGMPISIDEEYSVYFRGVRYTCKCWVNDKYGTYYRFLGNGIHYDSELPQSAENEPFCVLVDIQDEPVATLYFTGPENGGYYGDDGEEPFYVQKLIPDELVRLDEKFLPESVLTISDTEMAQLENLLNQTTTED